MGERVQVQRLMGPLRCFLASSAVEEVQNTRTKQRDPDEYEAGSMGSGFKLLGHSPVPPTAIECKLCDAVCLSFLSP